MRKGKYFIAGALCLITVSALALDPIYEMPRPKKSSSKIDHFVLKKLRQENIKPAALSSDAVFLRRIYQDLAGSVPTIEQARRFLSDKSPEKRSKLIDSLLNSEAYYEYWTLKYCDLLRVKSEFPINLWPNATQAYNRWIYDAVKDNMPYDRFARKLLLASGSNFRQPEVNFYRAVTKKTPEGFAGAAMLTFMGTRFEKWPAAKRKDILTFFSGIKFKSTKEWKEQIVYADMSCGKPIAAKFPDGKTVNIPPSSDPREAFVKWLISAKNPWFARCQVNRIWYYLMGRGIINEADDITPDCQASNPALLSYLEKEFIKSGYDSKHIIRLIVNSDTYQQSFIPADKSPRAEKLFAHYIIRRLDAEIIIDLIDSYGHGWRRQRHKYVSMIPEPFTFIPAENRTVALADGSISSKFLSVFGRPARDTGYLSERINSSSDAQRLFLLNSNYAKQRLNQATVKVARANKWNRRKICDQLYLLFLSRYPSESEKKIIWNFAKANKLKGYQIATYLSWALFNSKEFIFHH